MSQAASIVGEKLSSGDIFKMPNSVLDDGILLCRWFCQAVHATCRGFAIGGPDRREPDSSNLP